MSFPDDCIKGIPSDEFLTVEGVPASHLFYFKAGVDRDDGWGEQSINWADDDTVIEFTLSQTKADGDFQFKAGAAVISREEIDRLKDRPAIRGLLAYERQATQDNPYHGNLLLQANTSKPTEKIVAAGLALAVSEIIPRDDTN